MQIDAAPAERPAMNTSFLAAAQVVQTSGDVWLVTAGSPATVHDHALLAEGQLLKTGDDGMVRLKLASGHALELGPQQTLLLDADVLADAHTDPGEWALDGHANPAMVAEWLEPTAQPLQLAAVIEAPGENLEDLLQGTAPVTADSDQMHQLLLAGIHDDGLACLLRSLYGPESG